MTVTSSQRIAQQQAFEDAGELAPERAQTVHSFDDGWRVVRLATAGDIRREGLLMRNCLAQYAGDELVSERRGEIALGPLADEDPAPAIVVGSHGAMNLRGRHTDASLYSLRDSANLPHLTWWAKEGSHACGALGYRNSRPKDGYRERLKQWSEAAGIATYDSETHLRLHEVDAASDEFGAALQARLEHVRAICSQAKPWLDGTTRGAQRDKYLKKLEAAFERLVHHAVRSEALVRKFDELIAQDQSWIRQVKRWIVNPPPGTTDEQLQKRLVERVANVRNLRRRRRCMIERRKRVLRIMSDQERVDAWSKDRRMQLHRSARTRQRSASRKHGRKRP